MSSIPSSGRKVYGSTATSPNDVHSHDEGESAIQVTGTTKARRVLASIGVVLSVLLVGLLVVAATVNKGFNSNISTTWTSVTSLILPRSATTTTTTATTSSITPSLPVGSSSSASVSSSSSSSSSLIPDASGAIPSAPIDAPASPTAKPTRITPSPVTKVPTTPKPSTPAAKPVTSPFAAPSTSSESSPSISTSTNGVSESSSTDSSTDANGDVTTQVKPNFIFIVADDLGWNSLGYNDDDISFATPIMTKMAREGVILDNFYSQEVCSPARGSLLTGRYPLSIGMQYGMVAATAEWGMPLDEVTIAEVLQDNHYTTHMLGKWHLGYFSPLFLPTARGFDTWIGYANGENYYWSKRSPDYPEFVDFIESTKDCYWTYSEDDRHEYSTTFYTNKALTILDEHPASDPLFLYLSYQAVHDPFVDYGKFRTGMPDSYLDSSILEKIHTEIKGRQRQEYVKSLYMLDKAVGQIYDKVNEKGLMDNTYIIFMSDNGGCFYGGGKNGPLRGSKGTLFEGGIKVDSFIYSPRLQNPGTIYSGLMHVSDWFPTMLALASISYEPDDDHALDGVNQVPGWQDIASAPRSSMLYNMYLDLTDYDFNIWYNGSFAVRDNRFKLMHTYDDPDYGAWYTPTDEIEGDDDLESDNRCAQQFVTGTFTYWLFDLDADPYETTNLYDSTDETYVDAKEKLYQLLPGFESRSKTKISIHWAKSANKYWQANGGILPWADTDNLVNGAEYDYPVYCPSEATSRRNKSKK